MTIVSAEILRELGTFDTPTICNAIEVVDPERRNRGFSTVSYTHLTLPTILLV